MSKECPTTKIQMEVVINLDIGTWDFIGHWDLDIGNLTFKICK